MDNIDEIKIELKRGIYKICQEPLMLKIASLDKFEQFYKDIFQNYEVQYNVETIRQKRDFVAAITKYFLLDRLIDCLVVENSKYNYRNNVDIAVSLSETIDKYFEINKLSTSLTDFITKYTEFYNIEVKNFTDEISKNRDDSLSNFAKTIEKTYYSNGKK